MREVQFVRMEVLAPGTIIHASGARRVEIWLEDSAMAAGVTINNVLAHSGSNVFEVPAGIDAAILQDFKIVIPEGSRHRAFVTLTFLK